jgi:hypothetical protein
MIRKVFLQISDGFAGLIEGGVQEKDIKHYCLREYGRITAIPDKPPGVGKDLFKIGDLLYRIGWLEDQRKKGRYVNETSQMASSELGKWMAFLKAHTVIEKGIYFVGGSNILDHLDEFNERKNKRLIDNNLEKMLRHVEVKRRKSLASFSNDLSPSQIWLERYDTSILFSRFARRHNDLRFLNAAYKLNDWFFKEKAGRDTIECQARFVLALCEQETSSKELLK